MTRGRFVRNLPAYAQHEGDWVCFSASCSLIAGTWSTAYIMMHRVTPRDICGERIELWWAGNAASSLCCFVTAVPCYLLRRTGHYTIFNCAIAVVFWLFMVNTLVLWPIVGHWIFFSECSQWDVDERSPLFRDGIRYLRVLYGMYFVMAGVAITPTLLGKPGAIPSMTLVDDQPAPEEKGSRS
eukprot:TRINITY_DN43069_c0_g1_i1.p1 TRINITY_DN43069_c0_g1~~TRINITY_DN43069_c0_g1_i1.p1  ORF type:complete len:198 (+),score=31.19 TRINITY_DN43069_c0_g1_i1:46-594(+)